MAQNTGTSLADILAAAFPDFPRPSINSALEGAGFDIDVAASILLDAETDRSHELSVPRHREPGPSSTTLPAARPEDKRVSQESGQGWSSVLPSDALRNSSNRSYAYPSNVQWHSLTPSQDAVSSGGMHRQHNPWNDGRQLYSNVASCPAAPSMFASSSKQVAVTTTTSAQKKHDGCKDRGTYGGRTGSKRAANISISAVEDKRAASDDPAHFNRLSRSDAELMSATSAGMRGEGEREGVEAGRLNAQERTRTAEALAPVAADGGAREGPQDLYRELRRSALAVTR